MAEKLSIIVALEGGKEIERQLEGIGEAGQKAFEDIAKSAEKVGGFKNLKPEEVTAKLKDAGIVGTEAFDKIKSAVANASRMESVVVGIQNVEGAFGKLVSAAGTFASALKGAAIVGFLGDMVRSALKTADAIQSINAEAMKLGLTIEQFDGLRLSLEKAGISAKAIGDGIAHLKSQLDKLNLDEIKTAFTELQEAAKRGFGAQGTAQLKLLQEAAKGTGEAAKTARGYLNELGLAIPEEAKSALERLGIEGGKVNEVLPQVVDKLRQMPDSAERTALAIELLGNNLGVELVQALRTGGVAIDQFASKQQALTQEQANMASKIGEAMNRFLATWERFSSLTLGPGIIAALNFLTSELGKLQKDIENTKQEFITMGQTLTEWWTKIKDTGVAAWEAVGKAIKDWVLDPINALIKAIGDAFTKLQQLLGLGEQVGGGSGSNPVTAPQGFAGGGRVGGRGSGTSDSNLAWVSRGEHIMPARAVAQPGVLAFLEALRRSGGNLRNVLDGMGRFALGGPVTMPAIGGGGLGGMSNVTIQFPGLQPIGGLRAPADVVEELRKAAAMAQVRSGGRKPSRYS